MAGRVVIGVALVALGVTAGAIVASRPVEVAPGSVAAPVGWSADARGASVAEPDARRPLLGESRDLALEVERLQVRLAEEAAARRRLEERFDAVTAQLALRSEGTPGATVAAVPPAAADPAVPAEQPLAGPGSSAMEKALVAAGVDPAGAVDLKHREDDLALAEMYLRDQATRENWLDTPRFASELASIQQQRVSLRDAIGDDAYDRYLFALGTTNRVRVDDVMLDSPAALAGMQIGDQVLRYNGNRLFDPRELVEQTRGGSSGESVRLQIKRGAEILEVEVPRGPLGLRINAGRDAPG